jgi:hypothetical protein
MPVSGTEPFACFFPSPRAGYYCSAGENYEIGGGKELAKICEGFTFGGHQEAFGLEATCP